MGNIQFFTNWELWEKLTFVLAASIVFVFFLGWMKLWLMQRHLKKHTILDEEKRVRQMELRKSGLPVGRRVDIPFGVRAIQSGVEVEGIWISRPATPAASRSPSKASSTTLDLGSDTREEDKGKSVTRPSATVTEVQPTPKPSPRPSPTSITFDRSIRAELQESPGSTPLGTPTYLAPPSPRHSHRSTSQNSRHPASRLEELRGRPLVETYHPTSPPSSLSSIGSRSNHAVDRTSSSSDEGATYAQPREPRDGYVARLSSRFQSSFDGLDYPPFSTPVDNNNGERDTRIRTDPRKKAPDFPRTGSDPIVGAATRTSLASTRPTPVRTYTDAHEHTPSGDARLFE
ncbi:hypothetical protein F5Y18DRAFT_435950 [Xylariaceae sp. FL1019]|nr:hypothetical protein F5Y18DRAFT_435950 [Xylariaceae sp. FL1019]